MKGGAEASASPKKCPIITENGVESKGRLQRGSEGQVLSKLCFLLLVKFLLLALKLTHHGILNIHYVYTELKGQKVVLFQLKWKYKM